MLEKKTTENKLSFWLPLRAEFIMTKSYDKIEDFGDKVYDREQMEREIASRINKVEIRKIETMYNKAKIDEVDEESSDYS